MRLFRFVHLFLLYWSVYRLSCRSALFWAWASSRTAKTAAFFAECHRACSRRGRA